MMDDLSQNFLSEAVLTFYLVKREKKRCHFGTFTKYGQEVEHFDSELYALNLILRIFISTLCFLDDPNLINFTLPLHLNVGTDVGLDGD